MNETFHEILEYCKAKAIENALIPSEESIYKSICRAYSKKFCTPLQAVYQMDTEEVIQTVFDDQFDTLDVLENIESILDQIYTLQDPEYKRKKEEDLDEFVRIAEAREQKRLQKNKEVEQKNTSEKPSGGSVNFGGMLNEEGKP